MRSIREKAPTSTALLFMATFGALVLWAPAASADSAETRLDGPGFAQLCNAAGQDFDHPLVLSGNVEVRGGSAAMTGCNVRVSPGAALRFRDVTLSGCSYAFNVFGGDRSALDVDHSVIDMGDQSYFLFDEATDVSVHVSHSKLEQCGPNEYSDVVVTASLGAGGTTTVEHSTLSAPTTGGASDLFGHVVVFAPTGRVVLRDTIMTGTDIRVGTFAGGTCKADHNSPEVLCQLFG